MRTAHSRANAAVFAEGKYAHLPIYIFFKKLQPPNLSQYYPENLTRLGISKCSKS